MACRPHDHKVFFFKQKTAYEIGTGDWSSDVCSSDLNVFHKRKRIDYFTCYSFSHKFSRVKPSFKEGYFLFASINFFPGSLANCITSRLFTIKGRMLTFCRLTSIVDYFYDCKWKFAVTRFSDVYYRPDA